MYFKNPQIEWYVELYNVYWQTHIILLEADPEQSIATRMNDMLIYEETERHLSNLEMAPLQRHNHCASFKALPLHSLKEGQTEVQELVQSYDQGHLIINRIEMTRLGDRCHIRAGEYCDSYDMTFDQYEIDVDWRTLCSLYEDKATHYADVMKCVAGMSNMALTDNNLEHCLALNHPLILRAMISRYKLPESWLLHALKRPDVFYAKYRLAPHLKRTDLSTSTLKSLHELHAKQRM